jgi:hypothetical protein
MQSVVAIDNDIYTNNKRPSARLQNQSQESKEIREKFSLNQMALKAQLTDDIYDIDIEAFSMSARHLKPEILGKVIDNLAQIYNEKTGQKIVVIFRKMIDDSSTTKTKSDHSSEE